MSEKHRIRTDKFAISLLPEESEILAHNAKMFGLSRTEYIRRLILFGGISGQPILDRECGIKLVKELSQISTSIKLISYCTPEKLLSQHPEWLELEANYVKLLEIIGQLAYLTKEERSKWQHQVSTLLHRQ